MAGTAAAATGAAGFPMPSIAQNAPMKVGVLTVEEVRMRRGLPALPVAAAQEQ